MSWPVPPGAILVAPFALVLLAVLHELAHVLAGRRAGFRLEAVRLLWWRWTPTSGFERVAWRQARSLAGVTLQPERLGGLRRRHLLMVGAGPAADLGTWALLALAARAGGPAGGVLATASGWAALVLACDLLPLRRGFTQTDGRWLLDWALRPERAVSRVAVGVLHSVCAAGTRPRDLPEDWLRAALRAPDASPRSRLAETYAYAWAIGHGHADLAEGHLARLLTLAMLQDPPLERAQMLSTAAYFQARRRGDAGRAAWLLAEAEAQHRLSRTYRLAVEAAIALAEGERDRAARAAATCLAALAPGSAPAGFALAERDELEGLLEEATAAAPRPALAV